MATQGSAQKEADIKMMCAAEVHLGTKNCNYQMERYVFKRRNDGITSRLFWMYRHDLEHWDSVCLCAAATDLTVAMSVIISCIDKSR